MNFRDAEAAGIKATVLMSGKHEREIFMAADTILDVVKAYVSVTEPGGMQGKRACAVIAALSVLFEEDHPGDDFGAMLRLIADVPGRPKSREDLRQRMGG